MSRIWKLALAAGFVVALYAIAGTRPAVADDSKKLDISGAFYTKWMWGTQRKEGSLYGFSTVPAEPGGDSGQGTEIEIFFDGRLSKVLSYHARIHSRFSQNYWTNFGGFGINGTNGPGGTVVPGNCLGGDCGELDPRSNQYIKLRGVAVYITPGWRGVDTITVGANDLGIWDAATVGKIRYIDRDNAAGVFFQGSTKSKKFAWDASRLSLPRLWAGPGFTTGDYTTQDAAYIFQGKLNLNPKWDLGSIYYYTNDIEVDPNDFNPWNGTNVKTRFRDAVAAVKFGYRPASIFDLSGAYYYSWADTNPAGYAGAATSFNAYFGYSPVIAGKHQGSFWKLDANVNNIADSGFSINMELFDVGATYMSLMAARRESDVLLTEGWDASYMLPGINNGGGNAVFSGDRSRATMGYGGYNGTRQQVATINVDNNFTDFDEPAAETAIGWKGVTVIPRWQKGGVSVSAEYTYIGYNTNWQMYGDPRMTLNNTDYPAAEADGGVLHNYRTAFAPFQDKKTHIAVVNFKDTLDVGRGLDVMAKLKYIGEKDNRMTDPRFLPYAAGDCPGGGVACANVKNLYDGANSTADNVSGNGDTGFYGNPPLITGAGGQVGYQWKPFDSVADDDRDLKYYHAGVGVGYQFTDKMYGSFWYDYYDADLKDGTSAFQSYGLHQWAPGKHVKNGFDLAVKYNIPGGATFGLEYEYLFGTYTPDYGTGFVPTVATGTDITSWGAAPGSLGFRGRSFYGAGNYIWYSLDKINLSQQRLKAFLKVLW